MFPWAVVLKPIGASALVEMMIFLGILLVGFAYVWRKGDLDWVMAPGDNLADSFKRDAVSDVESDERETTVEPLPTT